MAKLINLSSKVEGYLIFLELQVSKGRTINKIPITISKNMAKVLLVHLVKRLAKLNLKISERRYRK